ncbi:MAG: site-specific integrase [Thaumarchaeota archaeon]|nr:site-specific integrase [Nitrososphaerota archaeon]
MTLDENASSVLEKLDEILVRVARIEKALNIVPDRELEVSDSNQSIQTYEVFAKEDLGLEENTIQNQKSAIQSFLQHSSNKINEQSVKAYLDTNPSPAWKTNQLKALRRYIRDFLKLGKWIEGFEFERTGPRIHKEYPNNEKLAEFFYVLPADSQVIFLVLLSSGLRPGEVLGLKVKDVNFDDGINMVDASNMHQGKTKYSWMSFITNEAAEVLLEYLFGTGILSSPGSTIFPLPIRTLQEHFKDASEKTGIDVTPKLLRKVFADRCERTGISKKYIDAFCGRTPRGVLESHYTDYSPSRLREEYNKAEPLLALEI